MESGGKKKCFSISIGQIFGVFFCLGLGVIWYLWRMDYEVIMVVLLILFIKIHYVCESKSFQNGFTSMLYHIFCRSSGVYTCSYPAALVVPPQTSSRSHFCQNISKRFQVRSFLTFRRTQTLHAN